MLPELTFSKEPLTFGDQIDYHRVVKTGDQEALLRLFMSRTGASEAIIRAIPIEHLPTLIARLEQSLLDGKNYRALVEKTGLQ